VLSAERQPMSEAGPGRNECHYIIQRRTRHNVTWYAAGIPGCACPNRADPKRARYRRLPTWPQLNLG